MCKIWKNKLFVWIYEQKFKNLAHYAQILPQTSQKLSEVEEGVWGKKRVGREKGEGHRIMQLMEWCLYSVRSQADWARWTLYQKAR